MTMKRYTPLFSLLTAGLTLFLMTSCQSQHSGPITEDDKLTKKELATLVSNSRENLLNSKRLSFRDRQIIQNTEPTHRVYYTGHKEGRLILSWKISERRYISVTAKGDFFSNSCSWKVSIIKM